MVSYSFLQMAVRPSGNIAETRAMTKMSMGEREREAELRRERARSSGRSGGRVILRDKARHLGGPGHGCNLRNTFNHWIGVRIHGCETRSARGSPFPPLSSDINRVCLSAVTREYRGLILKPE